MATENDTPTSGADKSCAAIFYVTEAARLTAERLAAYFEDARLVKYASGAVEPRWRECRALIFVAASGIAVRAIAPLVGDKLTDPAVVVVDEAGRFAVSLIGGHAGGANRIARDISAFLGGQAVITTASDVRGLPAPDIWAKENSLAIDAGGRIPVDAVGRAPIDAGVRDPIDAGGRTPVENRAAMTRVSAKLLDAGYLSVYADTAIVLPDVFRPVESPDDADVIISNKNVGALLVGARGGAVDEGRLILRPKNLVLGIGCNGGSSREEIEDAVSAVFKEHGLSFLSAALVATIDIKGEEPGLAAFARAHGLRIITYTAGELNTVETSAPSEVVFSATGAYAVAEPAALLASRAVAAAGVSGCPQISGHPQRGAPTGAAKFSVGAPPCGCPGLLVSKQKRGNVTVAAAQSPAPIAASVREKRRGMIYVVGTGPGGAEHITPRALWAIRASDVVVGYDTYLRQIKDLIRDKETVATAMTGEVDRCRRAVELAEEGRIVSVVSGGDPGIYAMAGLVHEILLERRSLRARPREAQSREAQSIKPPLLPPRDIPIEPPGIEVIPGISALNACAARLGAPLMHDFAAISLSDRLTPWETILKRLEAAAAADFVIVLYNPKSKGRALHVEKARRIILKHRPPGTPVGIVRAAMRPDESVVVTDLDNMCGFDMDMQTTVIIGNSKTIAADVPGMSGISGAPGRAMITPRGYADKYDLKG